MADPILNAIECPTGCGSRARVSPNKTGGYSINCPACKFQGWAKTPAAASALAKRIGGGAEPKPAPKAEPEKAEAPLPFQL